MKREKSRSRHKMGIVYSRFVLGRAKRRSWWSSLSLCLAGGGGARSRIATGGAGPSRAQLDMQGSLYATSRRPVPRPTLHPSEDRPVGSQPPKRGCSRQHACGAGRRVVAIGEGGDPWDCVGDPSPASAAGARGTDPAMRLAAADPTRIARRQ